MLPLFRLGKAVFDFIMSRRLGGGPTSQVTASTAGGHIQGSNFVGGNQTITLAPPPQTILPQQWDREDNAPEFSVHPSVENGKGQAPNHLMMTFQWTGADVRPRVRWLHEDLSQDRATLTPHNPPSAHKYSIRGGTAFRPRTESGKVGFEVEFKWRDATCHAVWEFPFSHVQKYAWNNLALDTTVENLRPVQVWRDLV